MNKVIIAPSVLSADFSNLKSQLEQLEKGGADWIHIDVMDGHFVPNITFGPLLVKTINKLTDLTLDVHLMIEKPERYIDEFIKAGADIVTVHFETCPHLNRTIQQIHDSGAKAGVSINPSTNTSNIVDVLEYVDIALIMSVNPGFGGQKFIESSYEKIEYLSNIINKKGYNVIIEIDGGVDEQNANKLYNSGCSVLVSGTGVFKHSDLSVGINNLREAIEGP